MSRALLALACALVGASDGRHGLLFYDPDANHQAIVDITSAFNGYLARVSGALTFQPVQDRAAFEGLLRDHQGEFAIVSSQYLRQSKGLSPLLVPTAKGDPFYKKLLVDTGNGAAGALEGKAIAATLTGEDRSGQAVLALLREGGVKVNGAVIVPVSKDIDALLALSFGQVQAALVTQASIDVLTKLKPRLVADIRTVYQTPRILRSPLCAIGDVSSDRKKEFVDAMRSMASDTEGSAAMRTMGFDQWVSFDPGMLRK